MEIQKPKFSLFQQVKSNGRAVGTVIGIEYVTPLAAILNDFAGTGYSYTVDKSYGLSMEELVPVNREGYRDEFWEYELQEVGP